jgi:hypothetical protein
MARKRYNVVGKIANLNTRFDKNGRFWAAFSLARGDRRSLRAVAFAKKAADLVANYKEGDEVKLFGYFEPKTFIRPDGQTVRTSRLNVLWSGEPNPKRAVAA